MKCLKPDNGGGEGGHEGLVLRKAACRAHYIQHRQIEMRGREVDEFEIALGIMFFRSRVHGMCAKVPQCACAQNAAQQYNQNQNRVAPQDAPRENTQVGKHATLDAETQRLNGEERPPPPRRPSKRLPNGSASRATKPRPQVLCPD